MLSEYNLKAVVFDDVEAEAKPLIDALNHERIPNIFINFEEDKREDKKLKNIRLLFADLIYGTYYGGDDNKAVEAIRASILDNIDEHNGPFILVIWSKHATLAETLKDRLLEVNSKLNFVLVKLDKTDYFERDGESWKLKKDKKFQNIIDDIENKLERLEHLPIFLEWERDTRDTVSKLLNDFIGNISEEEQVTNSISSAIKLTLGKKTDATPEEKIKSFYKTLNTTLADSIINNSNPIEKHKDFLETLDLETIDDDMKAEINRKTLFENPIDNELRTGNIYSFEDFKDLFSEEELDILCNNNDILKKNVFRYTKKCKLFDKENGEQDPIHQERHFAKMKEKSYPVLLEFTPSCDIANTKYEKSRLIFGYMINSSYACLENKSDSLYITDFYFKYKSEDRNLDGNYILVFSIKNIFAVNPGKIKELTPMIRARKEFATDLQHAIANHISRIGISSLDL